MMPSGVYYIGDLCYVMETEWDYFCDHCLDDGEHILPGDRRVASYGTLYGDGTYPCSNGAWLGVDAGLIGCIKIFHIQNDKLTIEQLNKLGTVVVFNSPFETGVHNGVISFGHIEVNTNDDDSFEEDYDYEEEE